MTIRPKCRAVLLELLKQAIPERVTGGVQGPTLGPRWGFRGRSPREILGFYAILGVGELGFSDDFSFFEAKIIES